MVAHIILGTEVKTEIANMIDFDALLVHVGGRGKYQLIVIGLIAYFGIPSGLNALASNFISYTPTYR